MGTKLRFLLPVLTTIVLIGTLNTASAGKPQVSRDQLITSSALYGRNVSCNVNNLTDVTVDVDITIIKQDGTDVVGTPYSKALDARKAFSYGAGFDNTFYCTVSWFGLIGDIKVSFCRYSDDLYTSDVACVNAD